MRNKLAGVVAAFLMGALAFGLAPGLHSLGAGSTTAHQVLANNAGPATAHP